MKELSDIARFLDFLGDAILITNSSSDIIYANPACTQLFRYSNQQITSLTLDALMPEKSTVKHRHLVGQFLEKRSPARAMNTRAPIVCVTSDGNQFSARISIAYAELANEVFAIATIQDYSETQKELSRLQDNANTDTLTGLSNKRYLHQLLDKGYFNKWLPSDIGVAFFDLDKFKSINDTHGHNVGDMLLAEIGERLRKTLRTDDYMFRIGGDEFLILFRINTVNGDSGEVSAVSKKIHQSVSKPMSIDNISMPIQTNASIGIGVYPKDSNDLSDLITLADQAMFISKSNGAPFTTVEHLRKLNN